MMSSSIADFFKDVEESNQSFSSTPSSILLPSDLASNLDESSSDQLQLESPAWDENIVELFKEFADNNDTKEEHQNNQQTVAVNATSTTVHNDCSQERSLKPANAFLFEDDLLETATQKQKNEHASYETHCFVPSSTENINHSPSQPAAASQHSPHGIATGHHTHTEQRALDNDWNTHTQYSADRLVDGWEDSGFDESTKSAQAEGPLSAPLLPEEEEGSQLSERHREIQTKIVDLLQQIERCVTEGIPLPIRRSKARWETCKIENGILQTIEPSQDGRTIRPWNTRRLQLMVQLLATIYQLLTTGSSCTKRELYYLHLELAQTPAYTYATLEDVCALLDADPWELHVYNTSKGLIAGPIVLTLSDGQRIDCNGRWGTAVPLDVGSVTEIRLAAKLVLVVEKDTVFKRLLEDGILSTFPDTLVLITAKGYPDVSTRLLLKKISDWTHVPIYGLMDADPHGIEIFCVYKFGSLAMVHQQRSLAVPTMRWIGLFPSDIELLGLQGVPLREGELKRIEQMTKRPYTEGHIQRELLLLRQLATKVEIESLYNIASDFITTVYLKGKLKECISLRQNVEEERSVRR
ncbi:meiotic recombination protein SPO11 [Anopheles gambiae]|nr:meiotic recombination protein SPO11 [Anopheles gambiae]